MDIETYEMANGFYDTAKIRQDAGMDKHAALFADIFGSRDDDGLTSSSCLVNGSRYLRKPRRGTVFSNQRSMRSVNTRGGPFWRRMSRRGLIGIGSWNSDTLVEPLTLGASKGGRVYHTHSPVRVNDWRMSMPNDAARKIAAREARLSAQESQGRAEMGVDPDRLAAEAWRGFQARYPELVSTENHFEAVFYRQLESLMGM